MPEITPAAPHAHREHGGRVTAHDVAAPRARRMGVVPVPRDVLAAVLLTVALAACAADGRPSLRRSPHPSPEPPLAAGWVVDECADVHEGLDPEKLGLEPDLEAWRITRQLYRSRQQTAIWWTGSGLRSEARELFARLNRAGRDGLSPRSYDPGALGERLGPAVRKRPNRRARCIIDLALTYRLALYAVHLNRGRVAPGEVDLPVPTDLSPPEADPGIVTALQRIVEGGTVERALSHVEVRHPWYRPVIEGLARYQAVARRGGWPEVEDGPVMDPGLLVDAHRLGALRHRLALEGFLPAATRSAGGSASGAFALFDEETAEAVRRFQARHGLTVDGRVGPSTLVELNVPARARVRQIEATLEHMRWLPTGPNETKAVVVNIPAFELHTLDSGRLVTRMRTMVGSDGWETPLVTSAIRHVVFDPAWNIPSSIATEEVLPRIGADPGYAERQRIEVVDVSTGKVVDPAAVNWETLNLGASSLRLRQPPGASNPLGRVKFLFPNPFSVYLHDTPATALFGRARRAVSHGCIRLERPMELAAFLLGWTEDELEAAEAGRGTVTLDPPVPVHLVYWTVWPGEDGSLAFAPDVYGIDAATIRALGESPRAQTSTLSTGS